MTVQSLKNETSHAPAETQPVTEQETAFLGGLDSFSPASGSPYALTVLGGAERGTAYYRCKRLLDLILATVLLVLMAPLLLLIAILIKLDSSGPALYDQNRVGSRRRQRSSRQNWAVRTFRFYKFRSMYCDADESLHRRYVRTFCNGELKTAVGTKFKLENDSRITRIGRILRSTSLDEIPQLINVLKGDMSLVGPRPVPVYEVMHYLPEHYERFAALPGITGLWQVRGRGRVPFEEMMRMDVEYARNHSLWLDLKILLLTIPAVVRGKGSG